jgi:hypothetical protein
MSWHLRVTGIALCSTSSVLMHSKFTFTAGSSVFTNEMHHHDTCVTNQDTYAAASELVRRQREGTCAGSVAAPVQVFNIDCGAASRHSLHSQGTLAAVAMHHRNRFNAPVL